MAEHLFVAIVLALSLPLSPGPATASDESIEAPWLYLGTGDRGQPPLIQPSDAFDLSGTGERATAGASTLGPMSLRTTRDARPFPTAEGSLVLWFRPNHPLGDTREWLFSGGWASFEVQIRNGMLLAYATGDHRQHLRIPLSTRPDAWAGNWHLLVMSWEGRRVDVFLDGTLLGHRDDVTPLAASPSHFHVGYLRSGQEPDRGHFDGDIAEVAILDRALSLEQVASLRQAGAGAARSILFGASGEPVIVGTERRAWVRGETATFVLTPAVSSGHLKLIAEPVGQADTPGILLWQGPALAQRLRLETRDLRPGSYRLYAETGDSRRQRSNPVDIRILARRQADFPVGLDALGGYPAEVLKQAEDWGLSFVSAGAQPLDGLASTLDRLLFHGLGLVAGLNIHHHRRMGLPRDPYFDALGQAGQNLVDEVLQMLVLHGDRAFARYSSSLGSPFSPIAREAMRRQVGRYLDAAGDHPGLLALALDDEYALRIGTDKATGRRYYGDYGPAARAQFRAATGLEPPFPPVAAAGTVFPDALPYFRWRDIVGMPGDSTSAGLASSWADLRQVVQARRPDVLTTTWQGGEYGELDVVMDYGYPVIWEPKPHLKVGHGRLDFDFDRRRARQRGDQPKPVWALLGWWSHDLAGQPDWHVADLRLNTVLALAKGAKAVNWHTAYPAPTRPQDPRGGILSSHALKQEMIRLGRWLRVQGPMYARLAVPSGGRFAVLYSEDDRVGKLHRQNQPLHPSWFYPAFRIAGYEVDVITDEGIERGDLSRYEALVLADFDYASSSLWAAIRDFSQMGGKRVIVDRETDLRPEGATVLPFPYAQRGDPHVDYRTHAMPPLEYMAWMARQLREQLGREIPREGVRVDGSDYVAPFFLDAPGGRLLTLVNYHLEAPQNVTVRLPTAGATHVYDADTGEALLSIDTHQPLATWTARIPNADARRYLVLDHPIERVSASVNIEGSDFVVRAAVTDAEGTPVRFPLPLAIELLDPACSPVAPYARNTAADPASGALELRFPRARLMDPNGRWHVRVEERLTGRTSPGDGCRP